MESIIFFFLVYAQNNALLFYYIRIRAGRVIAAVIVVGYRRAVPIKRLRVLASDYIDTGRLASVSYFLQT